MEWPDQSELALLCRCHDAGEAYILRGVLETNGIECFLFDQHHAMAAPHLQMMVNIRLMVRRDDLKAAQDLIQYAKISALDLPPGEMPPQSYAESAPWWSKVASILVFILTMLPFPLPHKNSRKK